MIHEKLKSYYYLQYQLLLWYSVLNNKRINDNDFSILKSMKLLFFVASINSEKPNSLIDNPFNKFVAMPFGHVERSIYEDLKNNPNPNFIIDNSKTTINEEYINTFEIDNFTRSRIDNSVKTLQKINYDFVNYKAFELVELSHTWNSWIKNYKRALDNNYKVQEISCDEIKFEDKIYIL